MPVMQPQDDVSFMRQALAMAKLGAVHQEVPVGAVLVKDGRILASACNQSISLHDPSAHAEVLALRSAGNSLKNYRLVDTTLYVTLEPCAMCVGALIHARVGRVVFAASDPKTGALGGAFDLQAIHPHNHQLDVTAGVLAEESSTLLKTFFKQRR